MLIRLPASWPHPLVAALAMVVLALVDLASAVAAKEAVSRRSMPLAMVGLALYVVLFWVYSSSLRYADLAPVTLGWVVVMQVGVILLDRFRYGATLSRGQWAAVAVLLVAQAYLLLARQAPAEPGPEPAPAAVAAPAPPVAAPGVLITDDVWTAPDRLPGRLPGRQSGHRAGHPAPAHHAAQRTTRAR